jgi:hypothetical protein
LSMKKLAAEIKALETKLADFGYGEMQQIDSHGWNDIKKAILASHKSSPYKKVNIKPMQENLKFSSSHGGGFSEATCDITCQFDSDADSSLHSVTAKLKVSTNGTEINLTVQTRYNQA